METLDDVMLETDDKMTKCIQHLQEGFSGLRTGKASPSLVENVQVSYYDTPTRLRDIAGIAAPEARLLVINSYDPTALPAIEKAILAANLGVTPMNDGRVIRLVIPELSEERRKELTKVAKRLSEDGRIAVRGVRREANDRIRALQKNGKITEDERDQSLEQVQKDTDSTIAKIDALFAAPAVVPDVANPPALDPLAPTAVFFVGKNRGIGMHALLWVQRLFPGHFKNFVFLSVGEVDAQSYGGRGALRTLQYTLENSLRYYVNFCHSHGFAATSYIGFDTDPVEELSKLTEIVAKDYPNNMCFASKLIFAHDNLFTRSLHNETALSMQQRLHLKGMQMVILPMRVA